jgi:predicted HAD superfamily Cof-like phosphohydrolase
MNKQDNQMYYMVRDFHKAFNHKYSDKPTPIDKETALNRAVWTGEELVEFLYATVEGDEEQFREIFQSFINGLHKATFKIIDKGDKVEDVLVAQADALTDVEYFNQGSFTILGVEPFNLFKIVQSANMAKLHSDGKPRYREEDGKIVKPEGWEAPEPKLKSEIERQKQYVDDKFGQAIDKLMDASFDLGMALQGIDESELTDKEKAFLKALDFYCDAGEDLDEE